MVLRRIGEGSKLGGVSDGIAAVALRRCWREGAWGVVDGVGWDLTDW